MSKFNNAEVRSQFRSFLGDERFRRFIRQLHRISPRNRLRHWQEEVWNQFVEAHPEFSMTYQELTEVFRICEVHGQELQQKALPVVHACVDWAENFTRAWAEYFPHAYGDCYYTQGSDISEKRLAVWYCPECQSKYETWML